jgi:23S rRNA (uridine2552-2'-O)-methyltransferase
MGKAAVYRAEKLTQLAKKQGYPARSVFKLEELDKKYTLFKPGQSVLDLGCAPGSWLMYIAEQVGESGKVVGVDMKAIQPEVLEACTAPTKTIQEDIFTWKIPRLLCGRFDVVVSDMAPDTCGHKTIDSMASAKLCRRALEVSSSLLRPDGCFVIKIFQGIAFNHFQQVVKAGFSRVSTYKPISVRRGSVETYILARSPKPVLKDLLANYDSIDAELFKNQ